MRGSEPMSCFPEWQLAVYLDGELAPDQVRPLEAHLIGCQSCRALVVSLREETELLRSALDEREIQPVARLSPPARARGLAIGVVPAVFGLVALTSLFGWLFESGAASFEWLNPLRLKGAVQMSFDFVFVLRDEAPGLFELVVAMTAVASVASLLTYAVTVLSRRWLGGTSLGIALLLVVGATAQPSHAHFGMHEHENILVAKGEVHEGTLASMRGKNVDVDGVVTGDLIVTTNRLTIRGEVRGNVFAAAEDIEISGRISGSLHAVSARSVISGEVAENVYTASENFTLAPTGRVGSDIWMRVDGGVIEGEVGRDVLAAGSWLEIRGRVKNDVRAEGIRVVVMPSARVDGNIEATLESDEQVEISEGARIAGEVITHEAPSEHGSFAQFANPFFYLVLGLKLAAAFVIGMLLHFVAPWVFGGQLETAGDFFRSLGTGLMVFIGTPIAIVLALVTIAGIPLALITAAIFATALYCAAIVLAALVGEAVLRPTSDETGAFGLPLLLGLVVMLFCMSLPFVGGPIRVIAVLTGLGLLLERTRVAWNARGVLTHA